MSAKPHLEGIMIRITVTKCNLRSAPDTSQRNVITVLSKGDKATIVSAKLVGDRHWYYIKTPKYQGWLSSSVAALTEKSVDFDLSDLIYKRGFINLKAEYSAKYYNLYQKVKKYYSKKEFNDLFTNQKDIKPEGKYFEKLVFSASPLSIKKQNKQHKDWVPILVNEDSIKKGRFFYEEYTLKLHKNKVNI